MDPLTHYYTPGTIAKLERLTALQKAHAFPLPLLRLCALVLFTIGEQAELLPLSGPQEMAAFAFGLDLAGEIIGQELQRLFQDADGIGPLLSYVERQSYPVTNHYQERRARILARGKMPLLARISARMASR